MDVVTPAYRGAFAIAQVLPGSVIDVLAPGVAGLAAFRPGDQRAMVERHQRRVDPGLGGAELQRRVREVFRSYGRYYGESFRLPTIGAEELDRGLTREGFEYVQNLLQALLVDAIDGEALTDERAHARVDRPARGPCIELRLRERGEPLDARREVALMRAPDQPRLACTNRAFQPSTSS